MNNLSKSQKTILIIIMVIIIGIIGYYVYGNNVEKNNNNIANEEEILVKENEQNKEKEKKIVVHITGAIKKEGVFYLNENSRVTDAINEAGGVTDDADMSKINLAYILEDGMKIKIPSINDIEEQDDDVESEKFVEIVGEDTTKSEFGKSKLININKANQTELETLPGIGPSTALKIISYREENGKFSSIEDLKNISGIGESKFENIKNLICI